MARMVAGSTVVLEVQIVAVAMDVQHVLPVAPTVAMEQPVTQGWGMAEPEAEAEAMVVQVGAMFLDVMQGEATVVVAVTGNPEAQEIQAHKVRQPCRLFIHPARELPVMEVEAEAEAEAVALAKEEPAVLAVAEVAMLLGGMEVLAVPVEVVATEAMVVVVHLAFMFGVVAELLLIVL